MNDVIVRFINNTAAWNASAVLPGLASGAWQDVPADKCSFRFNSNGTINRVYIQNEVTAYNHLTADGANDFVSLGTGAFNVAHIEIWTGYGQENLGAQRVAVYSN